MKWLVQRVRLLIEIRNSSKESNRNQEILFSGLNSSSMMMMMMNGKRVGLGIYNKQLCNCFLIKLWKHFLIFPVELDLQPSQKSEETLIGMASLATVDNLHHLDLGISSSGSSSERCLPAFESQMNNYFQIWKCSDKFCCFPSHVSSTSSFINPNPLGIITFSLSSLLQICL